ncbi:DUF6446 family protein [Pseudooceanicola nanhaiensis]|uniref:DUF6446 family protein n=1 Tax=Pseudooceanicola nanhaiensis TaxID=375761 RepID=UPI001CD1C2D1|nr:DUF6446 family protein [Pseudooceanicola nanhaiensis]MCA0922108.1 DUF6446 family protein [Pseudooceanicola nanhaiensis]
MTGKILAAVIVISALLVGGGVYYAQVYAFYEDVVPNGVDDVVLTAPSGAVQPVAYSDFRAIDADSSPIRYRACFILDEPVEGLGSRFQAYPAADPLVAPGWFDCYDAEEIGAALESGRAKAYLSRSDLHYGIDRVIAVMPDGRGYAWNQINACGAVVFDGEPAPAGCPTPPESPERP